jgi:hypothetical protein
MWAVFWGLVFYMVCFYLISIFHIPFMGFWLEIFWVFCGMGRRRFIDWGALRENPGAPLIIAFVVNLVAAAVALALNRLDLADRFAEVAYFFLAGGVILQLISLILSRRRGGEGVEEDR